ncbi:MAG: CHAT domain-containing protein, partial [Saprospiraceae bacterium]|nr:CHAT domain-containing protein [Saprospiraceae bacterium]
LQTQLFEKNLKNLLHLPDSLVQRERELYFEINNLDYVLKENPSDSLREHKLDLERKYFDLRRNLLFQSSRLQAITNDNLITLEGTQKKLSSKTLVVDYFLNQGELFILAIGKHYAHFEKYPFDSLSQQSLSDFVTLLQKLPGEDGASDFRQLAFENYSTLLPFEIQKSTKELVIIPDNDLYIIPFDALIDEKPSASMAIADLAFLVKKYQISYLAGLNISRSTVSGLDTKAVAFAPFVPGVDENLVQVPLLRYTDSELQVIDDNFELEAFRGKDATEERFKHMVGQHSLLHIASHAIIDNEYPLQSNILFYPSGDKDDGKLQLWELYGLEIPAKLAVLSACKTADGALMKGAGIMNISRGFSVSGTDQVLSNLWPAQDFAASEVIGSFYRELKHDHDPAKALRQAKLNYLTQQNGPLLYPAYWAGWIIQYSELEEAASFTVTTYHWILICSISLLLIWFGFHRYAQRQEKK